MDSLDDKLEVPTDSDLYRQFLLEAAKHMPSPAGYTIVPNPGFCVKTRDIKGEKVFINVCHSEKVLAPPVTTDEALRTAIEKDDPSAFRLPLSMGEPHAELDHEGNGCTVFDAVVHPTVVVRAKASDFFRQFALEVVLQWIEQKHSRELDRNALRVLKNRAAIGTLAEQTVRAGPRPIAEVPASSSTSTSSVLSASPAFSSSAKRSADDAGAKVPVYRLLREPPEAKESGARPEFYVLEVDLPELRLELNLEHSVDENDVGAQFNVASRVLTVTMPVEAES